jgi:hypothetical protein
MELVRASHPTISLIIDKNNYSLIERALPVYLGIYSLLGSRLSLLPLLSPSDRKSNRDEGNMSITKEQRQEVIAAAQKVRRDRRDSSERSRPHRCSHDRAPFFFFLSLFSSLLSITGTQS